MGKYKIFFTNFGYFSSNEGESIEHAISLARNAGFQSVVYSPEEKAVASYCPIAGARQSRE
jgi:hypothetical protein